MLPFLFDFNNQIVFSKHLKDCETAYNIDFVDHYLCIITTSKSINFCEWIFTPTISATEQTTTDNLQLLIILTSGTISITVAKLK